MANSYVRPYSTRFDYLVGQTEFLLLLAKIKVGPFPMVHEKWSTKVRERSRRRIGRCGWANAESA